MSIGKKEIGQGRAIVIAALIGALVPIIIWILNTGWNPFNDEPIKIVRDMSGQIWRTDGTWSEGRKSRSFDCKIVPKDADLIVLTESVSDIGRKKGSCMVGNNKGAGFCDGAGEACLERTITLGCSINKKWHEWYKENYEDSYSEQEVCLDNSERK